VWHTLGDLGQRSLLGGGSVDEAVQPAVHALEHAPIAKTPEVGSRNAGLVQVASSNGPFPRESDEDVGLGCVLGCHDT
jgi:hypothetical protein